MNHEDPLFRALREADARVTTPPHVRRAVLAAWDAEHQQRTRARTWSALWGRTAAAAAAVMLAATLTMLGGALREAREATPAREPATLVFVGGPIGRGEPVRVVRMRVPAAALGAIGLRSTGGELAELVDIDLIVGEDGVARAIRFGM